MECEITMTIKDKAKLFKRVFDTSEGKEVLDIIKEDLGYNNRTTLAEDDRRMYYKLGQVNAVFYILDTIENANEKQRKTNVRRSKQQ